MFKIHKIENLDTLESKLNKMISELEIDNNVLDINFNKILDSDVVIIDYISNAKLEEQHERISELRNLRRDDTDTTKEIETPITELVDEFLQENKIDYNILRASYRINLHIKIKEWLKSKKGIDESSLQFRDLIWNIEALMHDKKESELRENIPKMKDDLYKWCMENNLKKITKSLMKGYFEEKDEWCPSSITDILYTKVNLELSKNKV